jgi:hypothetical protein
MSPDNVKNVMGQENWRTTIDSDGEKATGIGAGRHVVFVPPGNSEQPKGRRYSSK